MLILTHHLDDRIRIIAGNGEVCELTIVELRGGKVRLGYSAPPQVKIKRVAKTDRTDLKPPGTEATDDGRQQTLLGV